MSDVTDAPEVSRPESAPDRRRLFEVASEQGGYFSTEQAKSCGFSWALLSHHVKAGGFIRVRRGLYRFREYPSSPREHVLAAWLAVGKDTAVVSHESALELLGLSNVIPEAVHLTVPRSRRNLHAPTGVKVHTTARPLGAADPIVRDGMAVTSPTHSILDAAEAGTAPEQIEMALTQAIERGMATPQQLRQDASERGRRVAAKFQVGDRVRTTANLNVRTGAGTGYPEISDPDYPGNAPSGSTGTVLEGPVSADGFIWWHVDFDTGYTGWCAENWLEKS